MANDLNGFAKRMKQMSKSIEEESSKMVRTASLAALSEVVLRTPVDTGRARGNWLVGLGTIPTNTVNLTGTASVAIGNSTISRYKSGTVYIANNLPYIQRLNDGYSKQAPANFVEAAVASATSSIKSVKLIK